MVLSWLVKTPAGVCLLLVLSALPSWFWSGGAMVTFWASLLFSVASPVLCVARRTWWLGTALSATTLFAVVIAISTSPSVHGMREGGMVFMLPLMVYPVAAVASGAIRGVLWWRSRSRA